MSTASCSDGSSVAVRVAESYVTPAGTEVVPCRNINVLMLRPVTASLNTADTFVDWATARAALSGVELSETSPQ